MTSVWPRIGLLTLFLLAGNVPSHAREAVAEKTQEQKPTPCDVLLTKPYILPEDAVVLRDYARNKGVYISVLSPNPASLPYSMKPGFKAKTSELKECKTSKTGWFAGLVHCPPEMFSTIADWLKNKMHLESLGYKVLDKDNDYLVVNPKGEYYYSDYDLLGVYDGRTKRPAFNNEMKQEINAALGRKMLRHGPLEDYEFREKVGLKFPILIFSPWGLVLEVHSEDELRSAYKKFSIPFVW